MAAVDRSPSSSGKPRRRDRASECSCASAVRRHRRGRWLVPHPSQAWAPERKTPSASRSHATHCQTLIVKQRREGPDAPVLRNEDGLHFDSSRSGWRVFQDVALRLELYDLPPSPVDLEQQVLLSTACVSQFRIEAGVLKKVADGVLSHVQVKTSVRDRNATLPHSAPHSTLELSTGFATLPTHLLLRKTAASCLLTKPAAG